MDLYTDDVWNKALSSRIQASGFFIKDLGFRVYVLRFTVYG